MNAMPLAQNATQFATPQNATQQIVNAKQSFLSRGLPNKRDIRAGTWQRYDGIQNNNMDSS